MASLPASSPAATCAVASLVVWAIWEGRECARGVDAYLMGATDLPSSPLVCTEMNVDR